MTERTPIWLRALGWLLLLPIPLVGILPWWLHRRLEGPLVFSGHWGQWLGLWLVLNGLGSAAVLLYTFLASLVMHLVVCFVEEPDLTRRFGSAYAAYRQQVPRWVPRTISGAPQPKKR